MKRKTFKRMLATTCCLLMFAALLLLAACGGSSSPGGAPQATPTKGGYSAIPLLEKEIRPLFAPQGW